MDTFATGEGGAGYAIGDLFATVRYSEDTSERSALNFDLYRELGVVLSAAELRVSNEHGRKTPMLVTQPMAAPTARFVSETFSRYRMVALPLTMSKASDVEVLRDALVMEAFSAMHAPSVLHIGGYHSQHACYGREPHIETVPYTVGLHGAYERRHSALAALARNYFSMSKTHGLSLDYARCIADGVSRGYVHETCDVVSCTHQVQHIYVDLNTQPMPQEQVAAAMLQHGARTGSGFFMPNPPTLNEEFTQVGLSSVYARLAGDFTEYAVADGAPEFPPALTFALDQWSQRSLFVLDGATFAVELQQRIGPFQLFKIAQVDAQSTMTVWHEERNIMAETHYSVEWTRLATAYSAGSSSSSFVTSVLWVPMREFDDIFDHAMGLKREQFTRAVVTGKADATFKRALGRSGSFTVLDLPDEDVFEATIDVAYWLAYAKRFDVSGTIEREKRHMDHKALLADAGFKKRLSHLMEQKMLSVAEAFRSTVLEKPTTFFARIALSAPGPKVTLQRAERYRLFSSTVVGNETYRARVLAKLSLEPLQNISGAVVLLARAAKFRSLTMPQLIDAANIVEVDLAAEDYVFTPDASDVQKEVVADRLGARVGVTAGHDVRAAFLGTRNAVETTVAHPDVEWATDHRVLFDPGYIQTLDGAYAEFAPESGRTDYSSYEEDAFEHSPMDFAVGVPFISMPQLEVKANRRRLFRSKLRGGGKPKASVTTRSVVEAIAKRIADPALLKQPVDPNYAAHEGIRCFLNYRCRDDIEDYVRLMKRHPVQHTFRHFYEWLSKATAGKKDVLKRLLDESEDALAMLHTSGYVGTFKGDIKARLDPMAILDRQKKQTIVHIDNQIKVACDSALMADIRERVRGAAHPRCLQAVSGSMKDREAHFTKFWPYGAKDLAVNLIDVSQCDKSQEIVHRIYEDELWRTFGCPEEFIEDWGDEHASQVVRFVSVRLTLIKERQRNSGDVTTLSGNTHSTMAPCAIATRQIVVAAYGGDDVIEVAPVSAFDQNATDVAFSQWFNFPIKHKVIAIEKGYAHFFSAFLLIDDANRRVYWLPDPVKACETLQKSLSYDTIVGRDRDGNGVGLFEQLWISFQERVEQWSQPYDMAAFESAVRDHYGLPCLDVGSMVRALISAGRNKTTFREIWENDLYVEGANIRLQ